tara:strand:+ start:43 stop:492 length:450 start_codon:yes stop_codon:yes gene_type:complete
MVLPDRFWNKVNKTEDCWEWTSSKTKKGYGEFSYNSATKRAHRLSYEDINGKIPEGLEIHHICNNRICVNPKHLEAVTHLANIQISVLRNKRTHCTKGHELTPDNLVHRTNRAHTECATCNRDRVGRYQAKKKALESGTMSVMGVDVSN